MPNSSYYIPLGIANGQKSVTSGMGSSSEMVSGKSSKAWEAAVAALNVQNARMAATKLTHVRQRESWDCGLACVQMVVKWLGPELNVDHDSLVEFVGTHSVWTVDLVLLLEDLLRRRSEKPLGRYLLSTKCLSVNPALHDLNYYNHSFSEDSARITKGFDRIKRDNLPAIEVARSSISAIVDLIQQEDCLAIALVDNSVLFAEADEAPKPYSGHYIILAGVCLETPHTSPEDGFSLIVYNPGMDSRLQPMIISSSRFERAWRSHGTDEDIIFVAKSRISLLGSN